MVSCKKCGNKVPSSQLKLDLDLKMVVCQDCIKSKHVHKEIEKKVFHKENEVEQTQEEKPTKVGHKCQSCGYKFMINVETKTPRNCPYCNARVMSF